MTNGTTPPVDPLQAQLDQANATIDVLNRTIRYMIQNYNDLIPIVTPPAGATAQAGTPGTPAAQAAETLQAAAGAAGRRRSG